MGHITDQYGPYYSPIWAILQAHPCPSPREGSVDGWGKNGLRSSLLAFKTKWRKKGQNKSAQGNALGIVHNQHSPRMGKRIIIQFTPFATLQWWAVILLPPSGVYPSSIQVPGRCPGLAYQCPLRGVTDTHPQPLPKGGEIATVRSKEQFWRICYPPEPSIRILNPPCPAAQPRSMSAICSRSLFIG